jgi:hypothetical protein
MSKLVEEVRLQEFVTGTRGPYTKLPSDIAVVLAEMDDLRVKAMRAKNKLAKHAERLHALGEETMKEHDAP